MKQGTQKGIHMEIILDLPMDMVARLDAFNFDVFWNLLERKVYVIIEPMNAIELTRLGEVLTDMDIG